MPSVHRQEKTTERECADLTTRRLGCSKSLQSEKKAVREIEQLAHDLKMQRENLRSQLDCEEKRLRQCTEQSSDVEKRSIQMDLNRAKVFSRSPQLPSILHV